jgi:hypothetical protein
MCKARGGHQAFSLNHNRVLVIGGLNFDDETDPQHALASTELYQAGLILSQGGPFNA